MHEDDHSDHQNLTPGRLEAFSDGVMAIIITITILEFKIPHGADLGSVLPLAPLFLAYAVSFQTVGEYWNNHHILLRATNHIGSDIMWANLNLLFWLSFIPFGTAWIGENHGGAWPTALYASILLAAALAYSLLQTAIVKHATHRATVVAELEKSKKGVVSLLCYALAIPCAFVNPMISDFFILIVSIIWFIPDKRFMKFIT